MNVVLINPPLQDSQFGKGITEHIGICYIAGYLISKDMLVDIIEAPANGLSFEEVCCLIERKQYDIVGISTYSYNYICAYRLARYAKKNRAKFVFFGGYLPTLNFRKMKKDFKYVDCMVIGEGEITVFELIKKIDAGTDWRNTKGIAYLLKDDTIYFSGKRELVKDLDILPFPKRGVGRSKLANVIASRGCYANCSFCAIKSFYKMCLGKSVRYRSAENVVTEIEDILRCNTEIEVINFNDDNFSLLGSERKRWISDFCSLFEQKQIKTKFACLLRANDIVYGMDSIRKLKKIGLTYIFVGIESFIQEHLQLYNKKTKVSLNILALKMLENEGIKINMGFLLFNPITTLKDIKETVSIFRKIRFNEKNKFYIKPISYSPVIVVEGSCLYDYLKENKLLAPNSLGYEFLYHETKICFEAVKKWYVMVEKICEKSFLEETLEGVQLTIFKDCYYRLFYLDLWYLENAADIIEIGENVGNNLDKLYEDALEQIVYIEQQLMEVDKNVGKQCE